MAIHRLKILPEFSSFEVFFTKISSRIHSTALIPTAAIQTALECAPRWLERVDTVEKTENSEA